MGCDAKPRNVPSPFPRQVGFTAFFCFLGKKIAGGIPQQTWCWPLCLCLSCYRDLLLQMASSLPHPMANPSPADTQLHLPGSPLPLNLCPVTCVSSLPCPGEYSAHLSWQVGIFAFHRGGWNADKLDEEGDIIVLLFLHRYDKVRFPELNLETNWIWQLFWPFVISFKVN